jgi:hypothetical protein
MAIRSPATDFVALLSRVAGGSLEASIDGAPVAVLDGEHRDLTIQLGRLAGSKGSARALLRESHLRLWELRGVPSALARTGWNVSFRDGPRELVRLGRSASALTGHVHVSPEALGRLRKLL